MIILIVVFLMLTVFTCVCLKVAEASKTRIAATAVIQVAYAVLLFINAPAVIIIAAYAAVLVMVFSNLKFFTSIRVKPTIIVRTNEAGAF